VALVEIDTVGPHRAAIAPEGFTDRGFDNDHRDCQTGDDPVARTKTSNVTLP